MMSFLQKSETNIMSAFWCRKALRARLPHLSSPYSVSAAHPGLPCMVQGRGGWRETWSEDPVARCSIASPELETAERK